MSAAQAEAVQATLQHLGVQCPCGTRHRDGSTCPRGQRVLEQREHATELLALLRAMPEGTVAVLDSRGTRTQRRRLASAEEVAQHYASRTDDWGQLRFTSFDGGAVANSYGYRAQADRGDVVAAEGRTLVYLSRVVARTAPHGRGECADRLMALGVARDVFSHGQRTIVTPCPQDAREAAHGA